MIVVNAGVQEKEILAQSLEALPAKCRQAFLLWRFEGMGNAEIARVLEITTDLAGIYVIQAIVYLSKRLKWP